MVKKMAIEVLRLTQRLVNASGTEAQRRYAKRATVLCSDAVRQELAQLARTELTGVTGFYQEHLQKACNAKVPKDLWPIRPSSAKIRELARVSEEVPA